MGDVFNSSNPANRLEKAKLYCDGDAVKAAQMVEGKFRDIFVLKITFRCTDMRLVGMIAIIINSEKNKLHNYFPIVTRMENIPSDPTMKPWQEYLLGVFQLTYSNKGELAAAGKLKHELEREFTPALLVALLEKLSSKDQQSIILQFEKIISFALRSNAIEVSVDIERTSSLNVDETIDAIKAAIDKAAAKKQEKEPEPVKEVKYDPVSQKDQDIIAKGYNLIGCKFVLSPVKGKLVSQLVPGDKIKVRINDQSAWALQTAEKLGWSKDGRMMPGEAKVHATAKLEQGNLVYIEIAPSLMGKVLEEEEVRVYIADDNSPAAQKDKGASGKNVMVWLLIILLILGTIGVLVMLGKN